MEHREAFAAQLAQYGPRATFPDPPLPFAQRYTRDFTLAHAENFHVLSLVVPKSLRQDVANIYAFCRWSDDLGDEVGDTATSLELLDWWRKQTLDLFQGRARHPVMVALEDTVQRHSLPQEPFLDLISAFRQDQVKTRYQTMEDLLDYCRRSANPVGRLVLHLIGSHTPEQVAWSDSICTGLQLANFCQDVGEDYRRGRIYLPLEDLSAHGIAETAIESGAFTSAFCGLMRQQVDRAERWLLQGAKLPYSLPLRYRLMTNLFLQGGLAILRRIRNRGYNVTSERPSHTRWSRVGILVRTMALSVPGIGGLSRRYLNRDERESTEGSNGVPG